ncbi:hypothetical protein BPAE_0002g00380 [Botrytis paeoniae]|uniref:Uncharacterized protein n=1 Tax=Botrytis paeoniae TaxID=278948 RepID=A0A4Z1GAA4_9HELO|nr:hypothetical protein BPAE_0002g00380 [Botrytis paeoniae]
MEPRMQVALMLGDDWKKGQASGVGAWKRGWTNACEMQRVSDVLSSSIGQSTLRPEDQMAGETTTPRCSKCTRAQLKPRV